MDIPAVILPNILDLPVKYLYIYLVMLTVAAIGCGSDAQSSVVELELPGKEQTLRVEKDEATQSWTVVDPSTSQRVTVEQGTPRDKLNATTTQRSTPTVVTTGTVQPGAANMEAGE